MLINKGDAFGVLDIETNVRDEVISIGIVIVDALSFEIKDKLYYVIHPNCNVVAMYSNVLYLKEFNNITNIMYEDDAINEILSRLEVNNVTMIFAYNASFDYKHLTWLHIYPWYDIMKLAANKNYNRFITSEYECCSTGRLKHHYGVEFIMHLLTGCDEYLETHNALKDAIDELTIMMLMDIPLEKYEIGRIKLK